MENEVQSPPQSPPPKLSSLLRSIRSLVPVGTKDEILELCKLSGPMTLAQLMISGVNLISTVFCGHLGKDELAGVAIAVSVINVTGISIGVGLASACDTLISQTYGSGNLLRVGVIIQRAILIMLLACFPCWAILINTEWILLLVKQDPEVARICQMYVKIFMPALPASFMFSLEARYLLNQGVIYPLIITGFLVNMLNALINYILLFVFGLGVAGSAIANTVSQFSMAGCLHGYVMWRGLYKSTWGGWSKECLLDWNSYIRLAVPGMIMMCAEWWTYEIGTFLSGVISEVELGALSVVLQIAGIAYQFPFGFTIAGSVRVGNALGAGDTEQAKLSAKLAVFCAGSIAVFFSLLYGLLKDHISYIFSYDEQIRLRVAEVLLFYAPFLTVEGIGAASGGVIRGAGKQKIGAFCLFLGYYAIGLPIGVVLMFVVKLGIVGLCIGLLICASVQCLFLIVYLIRMDWMKATVEARVRAGVRSGSIVAGPEAENEENPQEHSDVSEIIEAVETAVKVNEAEPPPFRMLVLHRSFMLTVMLIILLSGILLSLFIPSLVT